MKWNQLENEASALNEQKDCSVKAVTVVSGHAYRDVHALFRKNGRQHGRSTPFAITYAVLKDLNIRTMDVTKRFKGRTVRTLGREMIGRKGCYLVWVDRHILAIKNGRVCDWTDGRLYRIKKIERCIYD